jgi:prepilin-type N-terminal cleavage/methylation domain-containing protein
MRTRRRGFTLMEVMITVAIMAIVVAVSFPVAEGMWLGVRLDSAGDSVRSSWADGQSHAMNESKPYRFSYIPGTGNYRLAPDSDEYWSGGSTPQSTGPDDPTVVLAGRLPRGVIFQTDGAATVAPSEPPGPENPKGEVSEDDVNVASYQKLIVFMPDGTATTFTPNGSPTVDNYAEIVLKIDDLPALIVSLRGLTGVVTSRREARQ